MKPRRGAALLSLLAIGSLVLMFAFTMAGLATTHYRVSAARLDALLAREAAEAGLADTLAELCEDLDYGRSDEVLEHTFSTGAAYRVSFEAGTPLASTNNLPHPTTTPGSGGRTVPPHTARLVAKGVSPHQRECVVECVVQLEATPFALAASGRLAADSVALAAAPSLAGLLGGDAGLEAHAYGGSTDPDSVRLSGVSVVSGDVLASGGADLDPGVVVAGAVETGVEAQSLPDLDIATFNNLNTPGVQVLPGGDYNLLSPLTIGGGLPVPGVHILRGPVYIDGSVRFTGGVVLDQAYVYVGQGGSFEVDGLLTGTGTLFVTGDATFGGAAVLDQQARIALFAEGQIDVPLGSVFQGALYSRTGISTGPLLQVIGPVIANHRSGDPTADVTLGSGGKVTVVPEYLAFASYYFARSGSTPRFRRLFWGEVQP